MSVHNQSSIPYSDRATTWIKQRRRAKFITMIQFFLLGAEFSLIIPTLACYLKELHTSNFPVAFGLVHGAYCVTGIIAGLVLGRFLDKTLRFRLVITLVNGITLLGNALYMLGYSPYMIILARFLAGVVESTYPIVYGELARCYSVQEFPSHAGHLMTAFCCGYSISPGFNIVPKDKVLDLKFLTIRYTNAPGAILFCLYFIQFWAAIFGLTNLSLNKQRNNLDVDHLMDKELEKKDGTVNCEKEKDECSKEDYTESKIIVNGSPWWAVLKDIQLKNENSLLNPEKDYEGDLKKENSESKVVSDQKIIVSENPWWIVLFKLLKRPEILILLYGQVIWAYSLVHGVVLLPMTAVNYLQLSHQQVSIIYIGFGISFAVILYLNSHLISKYGTVRTCIAAFLMNFVGSFFLYLTLLSESLSISVRASFFAVFGISYFLTWMLNSVALRSTLSKNVPMEDQSFCQGVFTTAEEISTLIAALTSNVVFSVINLYCLWSIGLNLIAVIVFVIYFEKLEDPYSSLDGKK